ncbi:MAG: DedA family protein [Sphingobacteriaceae bacterium]
MELIQQLLDFILHIDQHLVAIVQQYQTWTYLVLFLIIFSETGFVVTPFLPGDSLLFAAGALLAKGDTGLSLPLMGLVLALAAIAGNTLNYYLGSYFGKKVFKAENKILKLEYYEKTQHFFVKHGAKAVIFSRFLPIFRTVAPFVAGVGHMPFGKYSFYNVLGGFGWIISFLALGYFFGNLPLVKQNFSVVVLSIIVVSVVPAIFTALKSTKK